MGEPPRTRGVAYARAAEKQFDLHDPDLTTIQIAVLLGTYYGCEGDAVHEAVYYSVACRLACLLKVPECLNDTPLTRELGIRCKHDY